MTCSTSVPLTAPPPPPQHTHTHSRPGPASLCSPSPHSCRSLSLKAPHPKDAEALVTQACTEHSIQPNATTVRTLEKMWAVHEQLYG